MKPVQLPFWIGICKCGAIRPKYTAHCQEDRDD